MEPAILQHYTNGPRTAAAADGTHLAQTYETLTVASVRWVASGWPSLRTCGRKALSPKGGF